MEGEYEGESEDEVDDAESENSEQVEGEDETILND